MFIAILERRQLTGIENVAKIEGLLYKEVKSF
jgi:hypothetical protein